MTRTLLLATLVVFGLSAPVLRAQDAPAEPLRVQGVVPGGVRRTATESWGTFQFSVDNPNSAARLARVLVLFDGAPDVQYGRDVWVPGEARLTAWAPVGPAPGRSSTIGREVQSLLFDRTGGRDQLVLPPTEERVRTRPVPYRKREPTTALLRNDDATEPLHFVHAFRQTAGMPETVSVVPAGFLPPMPAAFDGIDHFVLASDRLAADPPGQAALRRWVEHGGKLWVMLDRVAPDAAAAVLGDDFDFQIVDRVSLTTILLHRRNANLATVAARELDQPVDLVRVVPSAADVVVHEANGWPASFTRRIGRGKVLFTTLGARGWHRPRTDEDPRSTYTTVSNLPVSLPAMAELVAEFRPRAAPHPFTDEALRPLLTEEIGYSVVGRRTATVILGTFVLALVALGVGLRRSRRPELVGWLGPAAAVAAGGVFLALGEGSRRAVPPTVAVAAVADAVAGSGEAAVHGLFAVYHPESGPVPIATRHGGTLDLDAEGLDGQMRRRIQTDAEAWHWEDLALPAGMRTGPFRQTARTGRVAAVARFGPDGVDGRLAVGSFRNPEDAVILTPAREAAAVRFRDGTFAVGSADALPADQFLAGTVLSDRQQRRQAVYRQLLTGPLPEHLEGRDLFLTWVEPGETPFTAADGARAAGTVLLIAPLEFERPPAGTTVTIPGAFVPYRRVTAGNLGQPTMAATTPTDMRLRFQLPPSVLPLAVEKATLVARVKAPGWRFAVAGLVDGRPVPLREVDNPLEPIRVEIADAQMLRLDDQGGLLLNVALRAAGGQSDVRWVIESLSLEVVGKTSN